MAEERIGVKFDFDSKEALDKIGELTKTLAEIGEVESFSKLIGTMRSFLGPIALVTAAVFALKEAFDLTIEGEKIALIEKQFDTLSGSVGIFANELKEKIEKSKGPTVDLTDALKASNEAIVKLGLSADKIPEIMEMSRKVTKVFGGEMLTNFDNISQAIASGNLRLLKHYGLNIDIDEATKKYARSIGTTVNALTEFQKQQAILNQVLETSDQKFKGISLESETLKDQTKELGVAFKDLGEVIATAFSKAFGGKSKIGGFLTDMISDVTDKFKYLIGEGETAVSEKIYDLTEERKKLSKEFNEGLVSGKDVSAIRDRLSEISKIMDESKSKMPSILGESHTAGGSKEALEAQEQKNILLSAERKKQRDKETIEENKFQMTLLQLKQKNAEDSMKLMTDEVAAKEQLNFEMELAETSFNERIKQIEIQRDIEGTITKKRAKELIMELEDEKFMKLQELAEKEKNLDLVVAENKVRLAQGAKDKIIAGLDESGVKLKKEMNDWGARAVMAKGIISNNFAAGFKAIGDGSKSAGQAMADAMGGAIGDMAENQGMLMISAGLWPFNPPVLAGGAALLALAGALKGKGSSASMGGGSASAPGTNAPVSNIPPEIAQEKKKSVSIQVLGNYFETQETSRRLVELIRSESDATDFKYSQIGVR